MVTWIVSDVAPVVVAENFSLVASWLWTVTTALFNVDPSRPTLTTFCRFLPMVAPVNGTSPPAPTVTVNEAPADGCVNRLTGGTGPTVTLVTPVLVVPAVNCVVALSEPPLIGTVPDETVPMVVTVLMIGTLTVNPPRSCSVSTIRPELSSRAADTVRVVDTPW